MVYPIWIISAIGTVRNPLHAPENSSKMGKALYKRLKSRWLNPLSFSLAV